MNNKSKKSQILFMSVWRNTRNMSITLICLRQVADSWSGSSFSEFLKKWQLTGDILIYNNLLRQDETSLFVSQIDPRDLKSKF